MSDAGRLLCARWNGNYREEPRVPYVYFHDVETVLRVNAQKVFSSFWGGVMCPQWPPPLNPRLRCWQICCVGSCKACMTAASLSAWGSFGTVWWRQQKVHGGPVSWELKPHPILIFKASINISLHHPHIFWQLWHRMMFICEDPEYGKPDYANIYVHVQQWSTHI